MKKAVLISLAILFATTAVFLWWSQVPPISAVPPVATVNTVARSAEEVSEQVSDVPISTTTEAVENTEAVSTVAELQVPVVKTGVPNLSIYSMKSKEDLVIVKEYIESLPPSEVANMIYTGEISSELQDALNIPVNFREIFNIVAPSKLILKDIGSTEKRTTIGEGMGMNVSLSDEDDMEIYVYDSEGGYTGTFPLVSYSDEARGFFEEANGVDLMRFAGSVTFNYYQPTQSTLFFKGKKGLVFPNLSFGMINEEPFSVFMIPVSASTRGSIVFSADENKILAGKLNIDFNGDGTTDVSMGISEPFSKKDYEKAFALIREDAKLPQQDRASAVSGEKVVIEYLFKDEE